MTILGTALCYLYVIVTMALAPIACVVLGHKLLLLKNVDEMVANFIVIAFLLIWGTVVICLVT